MTPKQKHREAQLAALSALRWMMTTASKEPAEHVGYLQGTLERIAGLHDTTDRDQMQKLNKGSRYASQEAQDDYNAILLARIEELTQ